MPRVNWEAVIPDRIQHGLVPAALIASDTTVLWVSHGFTLSLGYSREFYGRSFRRICVHCNGVLNAIESSTNAEGEFWMMPNRRRRPKRLHVQVVSHPIGLSVLTAAALSSSAISEGWSLAMDLFLVVSQAIS
jgi:hypothetical protein